MTVINKLFSDDAVDPLIIAEVGQNYHLIGRNQISKLKAGCFVINTARGELTDEKELVKALRVGNLGGIGVDVLSQEQQLEQLDIYVTINTCCQRRSKYNYYSTYWRLHP